ncbi:NUDIX hydrolase [Bacillus sp. SCS-151]|uniref:NUDIX hydrolase n=1 Tax=Nanhaiella sioensis TaxID=3115293 RepID=UPI00397D3EBC
MEKWKTLKSEYIHKSPFGNIRRDHCELPNGIEIEDYYVNEYTDWVNAIVITKENELVLVEQYRHGGNDFFVEVPAGRREGNETHEQGLIREVKEETGYTSLREPILLGEFMVNPGTQNNKVKIYLLLEAFKGDKQDLDDTEEIKVRLVDFDSFGNQILSNSINTQIFTVTSYFLAQQFLVENQNTK